MHLPAGDYLFLGESRCFKVGEILGDDVSGFVVGEQVSQGGEEVRSGVFQGCKGENICRIAKGGAGADGEGGLFGLECSPERIGKEDLCAPRLYSC